MDFTSRVMHNLIYRDPAHLSGDDELAQRLRRAATAVTTRDR
jgi:hypothetical protein